MPQLNGKQIKNATITSAKTNFSTPLASTDPVIKSYADQIDTNLRLLVKGLDAKPSVRAASTSNVTLSGTQTMDSVVLAVNDSVLLKSQTNAAENGIWVVASGAWARRDDADTSAKLSSGAAVYVEEGTTNGGKTFKLSTTGTITPGTTSQQWDVTGTNYYATPQASNKDMAASATSIDFDVACATGIAATPAQGSFVNATVNGVAVSIGNGVKTAESYFSGDGGTSARAYNAIVANDKLYWVGSVAGYQLETTDRVSFFYNV